MGNNVKTIAQELKSRNMADGGLIAWGQNSSAMSWFGTFGGAISSLKTPMHAISKVGNQLVVTPFTNKETMFDRAIAFNKEAMVDAKVKGGLFGSSLVIKMKSGKSYKFSIMYGKAELKQMLAELGF